MYRVVLTQSFSEHLNRNSSEVVSSLIKRTDIVIAVILASLNLLAAIAILVAIIFVLLVLHPLLAVAVVGLFSLVYILIMRIIKSRLVESSRVISAGNALMIKALQESLGGIRDILIDGVQEVYVGRFTALDLPARRSQSIVGFISIAPRYLMETIGILTIAVSAYIVSHREGGLTDALPWLGLLILSSQRMLPLVQQIYHSWATIMGGFISLDIVLSTVEKKIAVVPIGQPNCGLVFEHSISFNKVSFKYEGSSEWVFSKLDFIITKGARVGIVGVTGSGKTTLIDLLMGLLDVNSGQFCIDNTQLTSVNRRSWQNRLAHVPQNIYISDASVEENIAFGVPVELIDPGRVRQCAERAQLAKFVEDLPLAYKTLVGECGSRLSGGQRQRIGLARALYKNADVIILDEATSALDANTEDAVIQTINHLSRDLTIVMIAHRISTLKVCDEIVEIGDGGVKKIWSYAELVENTVRHENLSG